MDPIEIKVLMLRRGITQRKLAEQVDYTLGAVNEAINSGKGSDRLLKAVAQALDKEPSELWPRRFSSPEAA